MGKESEQKITAVERLPAEVEQCFPNINAGSGYRITSPHDPLYNCVAFAADASMPDKPETDRRIWDGAMLPVPGYYWPPGAPRGHAFENLLATFEVLGFERSTPDLEDGYEKVALYEDHVGLWAHAARQSETGEWKSKVNRFQDIQHANPNCFTGPDGYDAVCYMRRPKSTQT